MFHFHPGDLTLRRLRSEDVRRLLADDAETVLVLTGILWRTAWKYGARGYRHLFWDAGTMLANLLALAEDARVLVAFPDTEVNRVVGVDGEREASLCLLALGHGDPPPAPEVGPPALEAAPPSGSEREHPIAVAAHRASALETADDVARWRTRAPPPATESWPHALEPVLRRRGSTREFASTPVPARKVASILARALAPIPADAEPCNELYAIVNNVEGLERGVYRFLAPERFELLRAGDFRLHAGHLALEQPLGALSAATAFFMADLDAVLARLGDRGYRWAQLEAGIRTGRAYLAAVAEGLGATASTFFDDAVSRFLAPQLSPLLCVAVGSPPARRRPRSPR